MSYITKTLPIPSLKSGYYTPLLLSENPRGKSIEETASDIHTLLTKVFDRRPILRHVVEKYGSMTTYEISRAYAKNPHISTNKTRQNEFIKVFEEECAAILGSVVAHSAAKQLTKCYSLSTTEHHAPITHPNYLNSSMQESIYQADEANFDLENIIVLACSNISFDNYAIPRGLLFNSFINGKASLNQLVFFPRNVRPYPVYNHPAYNDKSIQDAKIRIDSWLREKTIKPKDAEKLYYLLDEIYGQKDVLALPSFSDQITKTNALLWQKLFVDRRAPNMVYLEQERIINKLIIKHHLYESTIVNKILLDPAHQELLEKHFDGIMGAFSLEKKLGTYLFWGMPAGQHYRKKLWKAGNKLVADDGSYEVELTPEAIKKAIENKELIPSTMLSYIILSFYYGLQLRGGYNQTTYLTLMKNAFVNLCRDLNDVENYKACAGVPTKRLSMYRPLLAFIESATGDRTTATSIDIFLYGDKDSLDIMKQNAKNIPFRHAFYRALPSIYRLAYGEHEQDEKLLSVTEKEINAFTGFDKKLLTIAAI